MASNTNRFIPPTWLRTVQAGGRVRCPHPRPETRLFYTSNTGIGRGYPYPHASAAGYYVPCYPQHLPMAPYHMCRRFPRTLPTDNTIKRQDRNVSTSASAKFARKDFTRDQDGQDRDRNFPKSSTKARGYQNSEEIRCHNASAEFSNTSAASSRQCHSHPSGRHHRSSRDYSNRTQTKAPSPSAAPVRPDKTESHCLEGTSGTGVRGESDDESMLKFQLERKWEDIKPPHNVRVETHSIRKCIRVVSYNILSQKLLELNQYLYRKCNPDILPWDYRWSKLKREIQKFDADVLCLQEVEECHYHAEILPLLESMQYECHYKKRTGDNQNKPDGVVVAYKTHHFELCKRMKVEYKRGNMPPINQDNVAVVTLLKPKFRLADEAKDSLLCIVNTHLLYNPRRGDTKLVQLSTLFSEIHHMLSGYDMGKIPIVMCGDFNSVPGSHLFNFITTQELGYQGLEARHVSGQKEGSRGKEMFLSNPLIPRCALISENGCVKICAENLTEESNSTAIEDGCVLRHSLGPLVSAYIHNRQEASTTQDKGVTVDYVFHTSFQSRDLSVYPSRRLRLISPEDLLSVKGIPNAVHPSDHLPIVVDFTLVQHF